MEIKFAVIKLNMIFGKNLIAKYHRLTLTHSTMLFAKCWLKIFKSFSKIGGNKKCAKGI